MQPIEDLGPDHIDAWWQRLPVCEIVAAETAPLVAPVDIEHFSFVVDYALRVWPHVRFTVELTGPATPERLAKLRQLFDATQSEWNARDGQGLINAVGQLRGEGLRHFIDVDVGSAGARCLAHVLAKLESGGGIARVRISGY
jgi:hypothetical protein